MSVAQGTPPDLPGYCAFTFTLMPVGSTSQPSVQVSGFADICLLTPLRRLYPLPVRQASALPAASSRFAVARDTLAVRLTLPLAGYVEDFHLQVNAPCRAHKRKGLAKPALFHLRPVPTLASLEVRAVATAERNASLGGSNPLAATTALNALRDPIATGPDRSARHAWLRCSRTSSRRRFAHRGQDTRHP